MCLCTHADDNWHARRNEHETCMHLELHNTTQQPSEQAVRVADVKATSACRLLELSVKDFLTVLKVSVLYCNWSRAFVWI